MKYESSVKRCVAMCEAEAVAHELPQNLALDLYTYYLDVHGELTTIEILGVCTTLADKYTIKPKQVVDLLSEIVKIIKKYGILEGSKRC